MYKLIFYILLFLLIFVNNISDGKKCKCLNYEKKVVTHRHKRATGCSCEEEEVSSFEKLNLMEEGESSSTNLNKSKKNALYICHNYYYSHLQFHIILANILSENYNVDMIIYYNPQGYQIEREIKFNVIYLPIKVNAYYKYNYDIFKERMDFSILGTYKEIIKNEQIIIDGKNVGIYEWLKGKKYSFGMAEVEETIGPFLVFHQLGIENTFNASPSVLLTQHLQFLGIDVTNLKIPTYRGPAPGEWTSSIQNSTGFRKTLWTDKRKKYYKNKHENLNNDEKEQMSSGLYNLIKFINEQNIQNYNIPSSLIDLYKNIKYHFVNQISLTNFEEFPKNKKIIYIGGFHVEYEQILTKKRKFNKKHNPCVIFVSFGTVNVDGGLEFKYLEIMLNVFKNYKACYFRVRINNPYIIKQFENEENIKFLDGIVKQQEILAEENTKLFIFHCGMNSFIEAVYAGIPFICIPASGDQLYISSLVEHLGIGIYLRHYYYDQDVNFISNFEFELHNAIINTIEKNHYLNAVNQLKNKIFTKSTQIKDYILAKINEAIEN